MFCVKCGANLVGDAKFCAGCGTKVVSESAEGGPESVAVASLRGTSNDKSASNHNTTGTLIGAIANSQQHLSGRQALKVVGGLIVFSGVFAVLISIFGDRTPQAANAASLVASNIQVPPAKPSDDGAAPATSASASSQVANNDGSLPAECKDKQISTFGLFSGPDDDQGVADPYSTQGKALLAVLSNGNFEVLGGQVRTLKDGSRVCMVHVHIAGTYMGNSYDGTYYAMAL